MFGFLKRKSPKKRTGLGRNEKKHIRCNYKNKSKCPDECEECCFYIKQRGDILLQVQAYDAAAEIYEEVVAIEPDYAEGWFALGEVNRLRGNYKRALQAYEEALEIDDVYGEAMFFRAVVLKELGMAEKALEAIEEIEELYDYEPCAKLRIEIHRLEAQKEEKEAQKLEEKNRLLKKMMKVAAEKGYMRDQLPKVAKLTEFADIFIPECFQILTGQKKYTLEAVKSAAVCSFYCGVGVAMLFRRGERNFTMAFVDQELFEPKGFACMDEQVCELLGISPEDEPAMELKKFAGELSKIAMNAIMNQVGAVKMDDSQMETLVRDSIKDVYILGVGITLL